MSTPAPHAAGQQKAIERDTAFGFLNRHLPSSQLFHPKLIANSGEDTMLAALHAELRRSESFIFSVAFVSPHAIALLKQALLNYRGNGTIITSTYLQFNSPASFTELLHLRNIRVLVHEGSGGFHPKGYVFRQQHSTTAIIGSSNLTATALLKNTEWNLRFSALPDGDIVTQLDAAISAQQHEAVLLTHSWIRQYEHSYTPPAFREHAPSPSTLPVAPDTPIVANAMQREALTAIDNVRSLGETRAIVVSATGTGKTILAALDVRAYNPRRLLFIVHREQIIDRAIEEFQRVLGLPDSRVGKLAGGFKQTDRDYVFATVQSLSNPDTLHELDPAAFNYVLIDEVHRAGAATYQRIINYFTPEFLLGFTATPERSDGTNLFELFDYNVPYEIRLQEALERDMLAPFHYYGVTDYETDAGEAITATTDLQRLIVPERITHIVRALETYGHTGTPVRGLMFCSRTAEAQALSAALNQCSVHGTRLRTVALTGDDSIASREAAVRRLEDDELDYIITVDIFNEGVDIPTLNQVVMLRQTESSIIFTQQLGRGLRKAQGKSHLRVIDFIGNYANNFLIPIALFGDNSANKDTIRRRLRKAEETGVITGVSSVNFDEISKQRVFASLTAAKLDSMVNLRRSYLDLHYRLGRPPQRLDFARFNATDPVVVATKKHTYWHFLKSMKEPVAALSSEEEAWLKFLDGELLNGKRAHELLVLRQLLATPTLTTEHVTQLLATHQSSHDSDVVESVSRILDLSFFTATERKKYGTHPVVTVTEGTWQLNASLRKSYHANAEFSRHVDDVIDTGLYLARHVYKWDERLVVGQQYSRKDFCRLMNWTANEQGSIFGYKVDFSSNTCPIFITYHKDEEVSASTKYGDEFVSESILHWFTRSNRTLNSGEVQHIINNRVPLHLFAKKDDAEGLDFFYLGEVTAANPQQTTMPDDFGKELPVVTMDLHLDMPIEVTLYDYLTTSAVQTSAT